MNKNVSFDERYSRIFTFTLANYKIFDKQRLDVNSTKISTALFFKCIFLKMYKYKIF